MPSIVAFAQTVQKSIMQEQSEEYAKYNYTTSQQWDSLYKAKNPASSIITAKQNTTCSLNKVVYGWNPYWNTSQYNNYQWNLLSHLSYFSYEVDYTDGTAISTHNWSTDAAVTAALANGVKVNLCVTLFANHNAFYTNATAKQTLITNLISLVQARGANGVNIDFESSPSADSVNFKNFMISLCNQMHTANPAYQVSVCLPSVEWTAKTYSVNALKSYVDMFMIMGYDYYYSGSALAGPTDPLYHFEVTNYDYDISKSITYYLKQGVSSSKLILGLPYYGRDWATVDNTVYSSTTATGTSKTFKAIHDNNNGYFSTKLWNQVSYTPYYAYQISTTWHQCWADDPYSFGKRLDIINQRGLGGMAMWALGNDDGYTYYWDKISEKLSSCSTVLCTDTIYDMGGPSRDYYNNESYTYTIAPSGATNLSLTFSSFSTEANYDTLKIYDGPSTASSLIGAYHGTSSPGTINSSGSSLTLKWKSDGATIASGWKAVWQCGTSEYRSKTTGNWSDYTSWEKYVGGSWVNAIAGDMPIPASANVTILSGHTISLTGTANCKNLTINSGGILSTGTNALNVFGNWANSGTFTCGTGTVTFTGSSAQSIGGSNSSTFYNLTLNNTAGVTLSKAITVGGILTFSNGILTTDATNILNIINTSVSSITGYSSSMYVKGPMTWKLLANIAADGTTYFFPVADGNGNYRPIELLNIRTGSTTPVMKVTLSAAGASTFDASLTMVLPRNWHFETISGNFTSSTVRITESGLSSSNLVGYSLSAQAGQYISKGGNSIGATITSNAGMLPGYYAVGAVISGLLWTGVTSTDWAIGSNWSTGVVPTVNDDVVIPSGCTYWPNLTTGALGINYSTSCSYFCKSLTINSGASLTVTVAGGLVNIYGSLTINGTFTHSCSFYTDKFVINSGGYVTVNTGGILYIGSSTVGADRYADIKLNGGTLDIEGGTVKIQDGITHTSGTFKMTSGDCYIKCYGSNSGGSNTSIGWDGYAASVINITGGTVHVCGGGSPGNLKRMIDWSTSQSTTWTGGTLSLELRYYSSLAGTDSSTYCDFANQTINNVVMNRNGKTTYLDNSANITVNDLTITAGTLNANGNNINVGGNWSNSGTYTCGTSTVTFNGTAGQAIGGSASTTFNNLTISNSNAAISVNTNTNIGSTLNMNGANTLLTPAASVIFNSSAAAGTITGNGIIQVTRTAATADFVNQYKFTTNTLTSMTVDYAGADAQSINSTVGNYGALKTSGSGTKTLAGASTVNNDITIGTGTTLNVSSSNYNISIGANWTNNGTFTCGAGTVTLNGSAAQAIGGSVSTTFNNLTLSGSGTKTITGTTINGILSLEGTATVSGTSPTYGLAATLQYKGSAAQTTSAIELPATFGGSGGLIINNSNGVTLTNTTSITNGLNITSGAFTVNPLINLTVGGITNLGGAECLVIKSDASGTGSFIDNGFSGTGTAKVEKYLLNGRWWYLGAPLSNGTSTAFGTISPDVNSGNRLYFYDESITHNYVNVTSTGIAMPALRGYSFKSFFGSPQTAAFTGALNTGTVLNSNLTYTAGVLSGYNLVCNPYPSAVNIEAATSSNLATTIWYRTNSTFSTYNLASHTGQGTPVGQKYIPAMQAFWVRVNSGFTGILQFTNAARVHDATEFYKTTETNIFRLALVDSAITDEAVVGFYQGAQDIFEDFDSEKMFATDNDVPQIYSLTSDNSQVAINGQPELLPSEDRIISLGFKTPVASNFTFTATNLSDFDQNISVYLEDIQQNVIQDLRLSSVYYFTSGVIDNANRFRLHFGNLTTGISSLNSKDQAIVYSFDNSVYINIPDANSGIVELYDLLGNLIHKQNLEKGINKVDVALTQGIYIAVTRIGTTDIAQKIIILKK